MNPLKKIAEYVRKARGDKSDPVEFDYRYSLGYANALEWVSIEMSEIHELWAEKFKSRLQSSIQSKFDDQCENIKEEANK